MNDYDSYQAIKPKEKETSNEYIAIHENDAEYKKLGIVSNIEKCFETKMSLLYKARKQIRKSTFNNNKVLKIKNSSESLDDKSLLYISRNPLSLSELKNYNSHIPKTSILLNSDNNFRIKMSPLIFNSKRKSPLMTPFQNLEIHKKKEMDLLKKKKVMNNLEQFKSENYSPDDLKRKILLKKKNYEDLNLLTNSTIQQYYTLPTLDSKREMNNNNNIIIDNNAINNLNQLSAISKIETLSEYITREIKMMYKNTGHVGSRNLKRSIEYDAQLNYNQSKKTKQTFINSPRPMQQLTMSLNKIRHEKKIKLL